MYPHWRGPVYPDGLAARRWLAAYAQWFDTVEVNNTFYRLPTPTSVERWASTVPDGFTFAVKVGRFGTHRKKLTDPDAWLGRHLDAVAALGSHLGPNLAQLPPRWRRDPARLDDFLAACPTTLRWAVEVRDPSWLHDEVFDVLARHGAALCVHDLIQDHPWIRTADWAYLRFHGPAAHTAPYRGRYGQRRLDRFAERLDAWRAQGTDVYAYFDNDEAGFAVDDARHLRALLIDDHSSGPARESRGDPT